MAALRGHGVEGDDLGDLFPAVFAGDVFDDFVAPVHAEVDVDVGHGYALGIQEALEQERVLDGIDVGDLHGVGDERSGGGATARADGDVDFAGVPDEVPDDEEVAGELHLPDAADFAFQAGFVVFDGLAAQATLSEDADGGVEALAKALAADFGEIAVDGVAGGNGEFGEGVGSPC